MLHIRHRFMSTATLEAWHTLWDTVIFRSCLHRFQKAVSQTDADNLFPVRTELPGRRDMPVEGMDDVDQMPEISAEPVQLPCDQCTPRPQRFQTGH